MNHLATTNQGYAEQHMWRPAIWVTLGIIICSVLLGLAATLGAGTILIILVFAIFIATVSVRSRWGAAACLAPVFLLPVTTIPTLQNIGSIHWRLVLAVVSAVLATSYWLSGANRPNLNPWSFASVGLLGIALLILGERTGASVQNSLSLALFAYSGLMIGQCLSNSEAIEPIAFLAVPIAILAILESLGLENLWSTLLHANAFTILTSPNTTARSTATFGHPLVAGGCLVVTGLVLLSVRKRLTTVSGIICIVGAATTVSRSTLLGGALGITLFALQTRGHRVRIVAIAVVLVLSALVAINAVPQLKRSFDSRVLDINQGQIHQQESVRVNSLAIFKEELNAHPNRLLIGGGFGYSTTLLTERGGNAAGYDIFDNEYITMMYDGGFILVLCVFGLLVVAAIKSSEFTRRQALPALAAAVVVMYFVDGMEWPSLSVVAWMAIGLFTAPPVRRRGPSRHEMHITATS
jgi:hypothetical protein